MFFYTYVLKCIDNLGKTSLYIGHTVDLKARIQQHNSKSTKTTKRFNRVELVYYEACRSKKASIIRERSLKTGFGRAYLENRLKYDTLSGIS